MLQNEASLAIVAVHTAENEPLKIWGYSFSYSVTSLVNTKKRMAGRGRTAAGRAWGEGRRGCRSLKPRGESQPWVEILMVTQNKTGGLPLAFFILN